MPMRIMVAHDGSENAQKGLDAAMDYFGDSKPEIILVSVVEGPRDASMENEDIFEKLRSERHDVLMDISKSVADRGFEVDAILAVGDARRMLLEAVESKKPDLLVVARRGEGKMKAIQIGSVSAFLVRNVKCPILIYH